MNVLENTQEGEFIDVGEVRWTGEELEYTGDNSDVQRLVERANDSATWDTADPPENSQAPVAERSRPIDRDRAANLFNQLAQYNGFGVERDS